MEEKNELSDIILEKDDNKSMKVKRILIIVALMILVFLVVLVVMKVVNKPDPRTETTKLVLPPQPTSQQVEPKKEDDLFKQVPIVEEENKKESFEEMVKSLKEKEIKKQTEIEPKIEEVKKKVEKPIKKEVKKAVPTVAPKTVATPVEKSTTTEATNGIYVQVGATSRLTPSKKFLAQLAKNNYEYRLLPIDVNGKKVTKILIGPYTSATEARNALANIKTNINKDAFIYRVK
jgi:DedD protein